MPVVKLWDENLQEWVVALVGAPGEQGIQGEPGVVTADAPITYDAPTQTVGIDPTGYVASVNSQTGTVTLGASDVGAYPDTNPSAFVDAAGAAAAAPVQSVNGETGTVSLDTDDVVEGTSNLYYTDGRADARIAAADLGDLANVDEGSGGATNDLLAYDGAQWVPTSDISVDSIQFSLADGPEDPAEGQIGWNAEDGTLGLGLVGGQILQVGEETLYRVKNQTGSTITNGTAVGFAGTLGASGILLAAPFIADGSMPSTYFMGVATQDILDGDDGYVTHFGKVRGLDLSAFSDGDILYVSETTAGALRVGPPAAPNNIIQVAAVVNAHVNNGTLFVRPSLGSNLFNDEAVGATAGTINDGDVLVWDDDAGVFVSQQQVRAIDDLTDVDTTGAADGDALVFDGTAGEWVAAPIPTVEVNDESLILATQVFG